MDKIMTLLLCSAGAALTTTGCGTPNEPGADLGMEQSALTGAPLHNLANKNMCLGVSGGNNFKDGTQLILWDCDFTANQSWDFEPSQTYPGYYWPRNIAQTFKCPELQGTSPSPANGTRVVTADCGREDGAWAADPDPGGSGCWYLRNHFSQRYMGVSAAKIQRGQPIIQWDQIPGHPDQLWCL